MELTTESIRRALDRRDRTISLLEKKLNVFDDSLKRLETEKKIMESKVNKLYFIVKNVHRDTKDVKEEKRTIMDHILDSKKPNEWMK